MPTGRSTIRTFVGIAVAAGIGAIWAAPAAWAQADDKHPVVVLDTSMGKITIELNREKAPISVENFLKYVDAGFYDNLIFHRVMPTFMIQGGGFDQDMREKTDGQLGTIKNEAQNGLKNERCTVAMARRQDRDSAQNQFYINVRDNDGLDGGYAVFGKVIEGMEFVDKIKSVRTTTRGIHGDVPVEPVLIKTARRKAKA
jgi:peptidyl-prolyl cis-trans isomerase A (cyclophilin A)